VSGGRRSELARRRWGERFPRRVFHPRSLRSCRAQPKQEHCLGAASHARRAAFRRKTWPRSKKHDQRLRKHGESNGGQTAGLLPVDRPHPAISRKERGIFCLSRRKRRRRGPKLEKGDSADQLARLAPTPVAVARRDSLSIRPAKPHEVFATARIAYYAYGTPVAELSRLPAFARRGSNARLGSVS
jgi:hypothetical protein